MKKYLLIFAIFLFAPQAHATTFYADFSATCVLCSGTATTSAFNSINLFANAARSAGDILIVRRGQASTTNNTAATFTSNGTLNNPIVISADYDNLWGNASVANGGFASTSETYTPLFGSTYLQGSASSTVIFPTHWVYLQGDCQERKYGGAATALSSSTPQCAFAYEVASTSPDGISLYLPYKGKQSGAGVNIRDMGPAPIIGTVAGAAQVLGPVNKQFWFVKGLDIRSTFSGGVAALSSSQFNLMDMMIQSDGATAESLGAGGPDNFYNKITSFGGTFQGGFGTANMQNIYADCNSAASSVAFFDQQPNVNYVIKDAVTKNCTDFYSGIVTLGTQGGSQTTGINFRNVRNNNTYTILSGSTPSYVSIEDQFSQAGHNIGTSFNASADTVSTTTESTTTPLRAGGGPNNLVVYPPGGTGNTGISTNYFPISYIKLFEYPIYAAANTSKTYSMYFMSTSTSNFTADPLTVAGQGSTTPELWIECEYYADATDANRYTKRSSTAGAFTPSSDTNWHALSVTCNPAQAGILYLRGWYAKPKETAGNAFYMDTTPVIQ